MASYLPNVAKYNNNNIYGNGFFLAFSYFSFKHSTITGSFTINKYITNKRIKLVQNLYAEGNSLTTACIKAGYSSYSSFYKAYITETGKSPKNDIENYNLLNEIDIQE